MVICRFVTGSNDAAFRGLVNTLLVTRKPFRSRGSGSAMATFLEENRNGEMRKKEAKNGRKSGASASRQAWKAQKDKTRIACGLRSSLGFFAESIFSAEDMKTTYASTRLRLYPYKDVRSRLSQQVTCRMALVLWESCCNASIASAVGRIILPSGSFTLILPTIDVGSTGAALSQQSLWLSWQPPAQRVSDLSQLRAF
jgi:hypothetical protein